jgi:Uma2 family endonuclease
VDQQGTPAVEYPVQDGEPMGETDQHRDELQNYAVNVLLDHFSAEPKVYVSGNNFVYYVEGDPKVVVSPDTYVVRGVAQKQRDTFKVWEHGCSPCFVLEITSKSSRHTDLGAKMSRYRDDLQVPEYFLFDPRAEWIGERLRGYVLADPGTYRPIERNERDRLLSTELGLELGVVDGHLRFFRPGEEKPLPTRAEGAQRAEREAQRADAAEAEIERLKAEIKRLS